MQCNWHEFYFNGQWLMPKDCQSLAMKNKLASQKSPIECYLQCHMDLDIEWILPSMPLDLNSMHYQFGSNLIVNVVSITIWIDIVYFPL